MKLLYSAAAAAAVATSVAAIDPTCDLSMATVNAGQGADVGAADVVSLDVSGLMAANMTNVEYAFVATNGETPGVAVKLFGFADETLVSAETVYDAVANRVGINLSATKVDGEVETNDEDCGTPTVVVSVTFPQGHCWKRGAGKEGGNNRLLKQDSNKCVRVLHINDFHAYVDGLAGGPCEPKAGRDQSECDGGWAKIFTLVKQLAAGAPGRTLLIDAGDQFMGTVWSSVYKGKESSQFLNKLCDGQTDFQCLGAIGNHEFDYGLESVSTYTNDLLFPVVNANILDTCTDSELNTVPRTVVDFNGIKVGLTGVTTTETKEISSAPDCINFADETQTISKETEILREEYGVDGVIAISHTGYAEDIAIAENALNKPDLIVGGHSHTGLWTAATLGTFPGTSANPYIGASGEYPTTVETESVDSLTGKNKVKVVQAGSYGMFVGGIDLIFNDDGTIDTNAVQQYPYGENVTLSNDFQVQEDADAVALINELRGEVDALRTEIVGETEVLLNQDDIRLRETNLGNLICDSILDNVQEKELTGTDGVGRKVGICVMNSGGIRQKIDIGDVTTGGIIAVTPFGNAVSIIEMTGKSLLLSMEHGFARLGQKKGEFPQIAGFVIEYNADAEVVSACRSSACLEEGVVPVKVTGLFYDDEAKTPIGMDDVIYVATNDFLARGGDSYATFAASTTLTPSAVPLEDAIKAYVTKISPITAEKYGDDEQNRIIPTTLPAKPVDSSVFIVLGVCAAFVLTAAVGVIKNGGYSSEPVTEEVAVNPEFQASNPEYMA